MAMDAQMTPWTNPTPIPMQLNDVAPQWDLIFSANTISSSLSHSFKNYTSADGCSSPAFDMTETIENKNQGNLITSNYQTSSNPSMSTEIQTNIAKLV